MGRDTPVQETTGKGGKVILRKRTSRGGAQRVQKNEKK